VQARKRTGSSERETPLRWQYRKIDLNDLPPRADEIDFINKVGGQGWELVAITTNHIAYFKHKVEEPPQAPGARHKGKAATPK
jgi:hypothetical protein